MNSYPKSHLKVASALTVFLAIALGTLPAKQETTIETPISLEVTIPESKPESPEVSALTLKCLGSIIPKDVPGIVFLSGGQSDEDATAHLNMMNAMDVKHPWELSYSYGRALQASALQAWAKGTPEDSQVAFSHRAQMNSLARSGAWDANLES